MVGEQEAMVPLLMAEVRDVLMARLGAHTLRAEGGSLVLIVGAKYSSAWIPDINNLIPQARALATELEDGLTS